MIGEVDAGGDSIWRNPCTGSVVASAYETLLLETVGTSQSKKAQSSEARCQQRRGSSSESKPERLLVDESNALGSVCADQRLARRTGAAKSGKTVVFYSLSRGAERLEG